MRAGFLLTGKEEAELVITYVIRAELTGRVTT